MEGFQWLFDPDNWPGENGIGHRILEHLWYSLVATLAALAIALPIGLAIGHTGRGRFLAANVAGIWRAIPTSPSRSSPRRASSRSSSAGSRCRCGP